MEMGDVEHLLHKIVQREDLSNRRRLEHEIWELIEEAYAAGKRQGAAQADEGDEDVRLRPEEGPGRVIALYLDLAREVDFWRSVDAVGREYAAMDRSTADDIGQADAWFLRGDQEVVATSVDWELSPLDHHDGLMDRISAERVFHDAPALFATVWAAWLQRGQAQSE